MPITVYYKNRGSEGCVIRPAPLISINEDIKKSDGGEKFGVKYTITLTGTLLDDNGLPLAASGGTELYFPYRTPGVSMPKGLLVGPYNSFDTGWSHIGLKQPDRQRVRYEDRVDAMFHKQKCLRELFARDGQKMEIMPVHGDEPAIVIYPKVVSIGFDDQHALLRSDYTITLEANSLLNSSLLMDADGNPLASDHHGHHGHDGELAGGINEATAIALSGAFIESFSEDWAIEVDEGVGEQMYSAGDVKTDPWLPHTYRISRNTSATAVDHYYPTNTGVVKLAGWENAKNFVQQRVRLHGDKNGLSGVHLEYPNARQLTSYPFATKLGSGTLNLIGAYRGFNHSANESVDVAGGSYTLNENWLLASGKAYENYSLSVTNTRQAPFVTVSIDGTVQGLSEIPPSGMGGNFHKNPIASGKYDNALKKYYEVTNSGMFGLTSNVYKRANNQVAVQLNPQPNSVSLGINEYTGEITYACEFDNRPTNIISGVMSENIQVNDTYPGDVFAAIPVIGRQTGPVLQYIGGRTEYKRDLSIDLIMDYTDVSYGTGFNSMMLLKPSVLEPTRTQLRNIIKELSPEKEPGVRKYFISAPSESWSPKEGSYNFSISWTYELDR